MQTFKSSQSAFRLICHKIREIVLFPTFVTKFTNPTIMKKIICVLLPLALLFASCKPIGKYEEKSKTGFIKPAVADSVILKLTALYGESSKTRLTKGVNQCAALWTGKDGSEKDFKDFCLKYAVGNPDKLDLLFKRLSFNWESLFGHFNMISLDLKRGMHLEIGDMLDVD